ncbi:uncharacterized protein LOC128552079 [Mercenaria mercenaria]|uniref:uncharacterized protein LOC128552079 n=1 Tax=Mercenaria mercenaria TaxID=6596 RepID=UPI00234E6E04|nr:uncharacterized protein LOC128552079 [Mercenaria mercenaria]
MFRSCVLLILILGACVAHKFYIHNRCSHTVYVGLLGNHKLDQGGFELPSGQSHTTHVPNKWSGRVWGRTRCGNGRCETGDCGGGRIQCNGAGGVAPATLAEITFDAGSRRNQDFYDISLVDGFNLQMSMEPRSGTYNNHSSRKYYCKRAGCGTDVNQICPDELRVYGTGGTVACKSACLKWNSANYCCTGAHNKPSTCPPSYFSKIFKRACPYAYSYAYDDQSSTFTCDGWGAGQTAYDITFC